jgi:hypothetical protein
MARRQSVWKLPFRHGVELDFACDRGWVVLVPLAPNEQPRLEAKGGGAAEVRAQTLSVDRLLEVRVRGHRQAMGGRAPRLILHPPRDVLATIAIELGSIDARDFRCCSLVLSTAAGEVHLRDVYGCLRLVAGTGRIVGRGVGERLDVDASAGAITLAIPALDPGRHRIRLGAGHIQLAVSPHVDARLLLRAIHGLARNSYPSRRRAAAALHVSIDGGTIDVRSALPGPPVESP